MRASIHSLSALAAALLVAPPADAADLTWQGRLLDVDGAPIHGERALTVRVLDHAAAEPPAARLVGSVAATVDFQDGYARIAVPVADETDLARDLWVEIAVDGVVVGPRSPLGGAPVAAVARRVVAPPDALQRFEGALRLPDGSPAASCAAYLASPAWRGEHLDRFWVDPDGAGVGIAPFTVRCDMESGGGGWAVWEAAGGPWGWDRDGLTCYDLTLFTEGQAWQMSRYPHTGFEVETDADFWFQEDGSTNLGTVWARLASTVASAAAFDPSAPFSMNYLSTSNNHVHLTWADAGPERLTATCGTSSPACGVNGIPANGASTGELFITRIDAQPSCNGATASSSQWTRNGTAFQGSYYRVRLR